MKSVATPEEFIDMGETPVSARASAHVLDPDEMFGEAEPSTAPSRVPGPDDVVPVPASGTTRPYTDLPYTFAKRHGVLLENVPGGLALVHRPGIRMTALAEARRKARQGVVLEPVSADEFDARLTRHYEGETGQGVDIMDDFGDELNLEALADALPEPEDLLESTDDAPVIRLINAMLTEAVRKQASDIHIEPFEKRLAVRYRVDGVMQKLLEPPRAIAPLVISRLKVMAKLDIAERRLPQDGRISLRVAGRPVDVRVSTPALGSRRARRAPPARQAGRTARSREPRHARRARSSRCRSARCRSPTASSSSPVPTGSGKTTTLYAALARN